MQHFSEPHNNAVNPVTLDTNWPSRVEHTDFAELLRMEYRSAPDLEICDTAEAIADLLGRTTSIEEI